METLAKRSAPYLCARKTPIQTRDVFNGTNLETLPLYEESQQQDCHWPYINNVWASLPVSTYGSTTLAACEIIE